MRATYYDGRSARAHSVDLGLEGETIVVSGEGIDRREPMAAVEITDALGSTPRLLRFVGGASCDVSDNDALAAMLAEHGLAASRVSAWERDWRLAVAALVLIAVTGMFGYRYGLPAMARSAADRLPPTALDALSLQIRRALDKSVFSPTQLSAHRLASLSSAFDGLKLPEDSRKRLSLEFRRSETLGANALALPSGAIFVTDELVQLTSDDHMLLAIIAHEAGHVDKRHGLRQILQSSIVGVLVTWYIGDASALAAAAPTALLQAKYSRDLEREADAYAADVMKMNGMPASLLADALELIERSHAAKRQGSATGALTYLSTHPATAERLAWLRSQRP